MNTRLLNSRAFASSLVLLLSAIALLLPACERHQATPPASSTTQDTATSQAAVVTHVDAAGAAELLAADSAVTVLDVRTPGEFAEGHLKGAVNVDFKAADFKEKAAVLDKDTAYLVHCRSGSRSTASLEILKELGFGKIYHLDGGFNAWQKSGQPVEK